MKLQFHEDRQLEKLKQQVRKLQRHLQDIERSANAVVSDIEKAQEAIWPQKPEEKNRSKG